jgi:hypothetical protein
MEIDEERVNSGHEASISKLGEDQLVPGSSDVSVGCWTAMLPQQ